MLAARLDAGIADEAQAARGSAAARRMVAIRHRQTVTEMYQESALREEMRIVAPLRHAREAEERVTVAGSRPAPSATAGDFAPSSYRQGPTAPEPLAPRTTPRP